MSQKCLKRGATDQLFFKTIKKNLKTYPKRWGEGAWAPLDMLLHHGGQQTNIKYSLTYAIILEIFQVSPVLIFV